MPVYGISTQPIAAIDSTGSGSLVAPKLSEPWRVVWKHRIGGVKGDWYLNNDDCPIAGIKYQVALSGCGAGDITLAKLNFPIDAGDIVDVYYNGSIDYQGVVEVKPDVKGGGCQLVPRGKLYENLLYSATHTGKTISAIFEAVVDAAQTDSGLVYNSTLSDFDTDPTITITYNYETTKKILTDLVKRLPGRYLHIDANGQVSCRAFDTVESGQYWQNDKPAFTEIEKTTDYSGIKATRYQVYRKNVNENKRAGEVGYGGSYPTLAIETLIGKLEAKYTVPETVANDTAALVAAYAVLNNQEWLESVEVKDIYLERWKPEIFELVTVQDREAEILRTLITCDAVDDDAGKWYGGSLDTADYCEGTGSIQMDSGVLIYQFDNIRRFNGLESVGAMIKSNVSGAYLTLCTGPTFPGAYLGAGLWGAGVWPGLDLSTYDGRQIYLSASSIWTYNNINYSGNIAFIALYYSGSPASAATINIDRVQVYERNRNSYTENVCEYQVEVRPSETRVNATLKAYKKAANESAFETSDTLRRVALIQQT